MYAAFLYLFTTYCNNSVSDSHGLVLTYFTLETDSRDEQ